MATPDAGALSEEQRQRLADFKIRARVSNETYLRERREIQLLLSGFIREVLLRRPENIREFAAAHFTNPAVAQSIREKMGAPAVPREREGPQHRDTPLT
ncbi:hypothetical protein XENTR_v10022856 [Xenopus tropicalis]|uniref:RIIa domain-containing protein 1 n=1 Tax=Xenopus tropicalis TaxID=8364 RepID=A0A803K9S7_XENTR|nr:RIIa domain-containing protein 1 [Xenopus tropicalis]KAE8589007.1 hypothetical protein XENTR_v10022856 [Xenopus tropicalis]